MQTYDFQNTYLTQKQCYKSGFTHSISFRIEQLDILKQAIRKYQNEIVDACYKDMGKPEMEAYLSEVVLTIAHLDLMLKNLKSWSRPQKVRMPAGHLPGSAFVYPEPYGVTLIISPWNYPFQLAIVPLIGAIAAGNCAVIKPSELSVYTSKIIAKMIAEFFNPEFISVIEGGADVAEQLLENRWDFIFFTGSPHIGRKVMHAASQYLTPLVLELGGKSPCIVDKEVSLEVAVKRIAHGKFFNAGQSCVASDYVVVHESIKDQFLKLMESSIKNFYGDLEKPLKDMALIINDNHFNRLQKFIDQSNVVIGGHTNFEKRYISPTVLDHVQWNDPIMEDEIFGPVLPVLTYNDLNQVIEEINRRPKPLNLYFFSNNRNNQDKILHFTRSGNLSINDSLVHFVMTDLPFGGTGTSGMGKYHGKASFDAFSHHKSVLKKSLLFDVKQRFAPYTLSRKGSERLFRFLSG
jgi:aldehyde dehydrogenase (NAD+)